MAQYSINKTWYPILMAGTQANKTVIWVVRHFGDAAHHSVIWIVESFGIFCMKNSKPQGRYS
jgi:hypothetical protein